MERSENGRKSLTLATNSIKSIYKSGHILNVHWNENMTHTFYCKDDATADEVQKQLLTFVDAKKVMVINDAHPEEHYIMDLIQATESPTVSLSQRDDMPQPCALALEELK